MMRRMTDPRWLALYVVGYALAMVIFYLLSSVIRLLAGTSGSAAWVPNSTVIGTWVGFALWSLTAIVIVWLVNQRRENRATKRRE
jgi:membrane protein implicated in regulation of membrane protease activity